MATLKEFEEALKSYNMVSALAVLEELRKRDRARRSAAAAPRRVTARKMTPELARAVLALHRTTALTQQEIAFKLGVNQGRVNEVIKHGKWLNDDPAAPERVARDRALARTGRMPRAAAVRPKASAKGAPAPEVAMRRPRKPTPPSQLALGDF